MASLASPAYVVSKSSHSRASAIRKLRKIFSPPLSSFASLFQIDLCLVRRQSIHEQAGAMMRPECDVTCVHQRAMQFELVDDYVSVPDFDL